MMAMERLSHDLNLALEESNCERPDRRKLGLRRRTRSAGNLPSAVAVAVSFADRDESDSDSPPPAPLVTQPLSDSDDPQHNAQQGVNRGRYFCPVGNFESDSFNENFSPSRPANTRRKRKFKKMPGDFVIEGNRTFIISPPPLVMIGNRPEPLVNSRPGPSRSPNPPPALKPKERNTFCGKRKWSHRDKGDCCEMRERSFSGGCTSKSVYLAKRYEFNKSITNDKKRKDAVLQPGKIVLKSNDSEEMPSTNSMNTPSLPGSSSFNFVYKSAGYQISQLPPHFNSLPGTTRWGVDVKHRKARGHKGHPLYFLRNPLNFEESTSGGSGMECAGNESSSLSSSDSEGIVTNDSDREGDDELTDWPGIEELKVFNRSLTFKSSKINNNNNSSSNSCHNSITNMPPPKRIKKEKHLVSSNGSSCKNRFKKKRAKVDSGNDDDAYMSDSQTVVDVRELVVNKDSIMQPPSSFSSFRDIKNAGGLGRNADESFFQSFQAYQEKAGYKDEIINQTPRSNFSLQKTSSSELNASEKSPQSDHYCSEHSMGGGGEEAGEVREIRAGCRRIRDERPGLLILSSANEHLSRFLQDSYQNELKLPFLSDPAEGDKLQSLAKLYSLELKLEMGRPVLRKTSATTQAVPVESGSAGVPSEHKRRCYGEGEMSRVLAHSGRRLSGAAAAAAAAGVAGVAGAAPPPQPDAHMERVLDDALDDNFSNSLIETALRDPGELD